MVLCVTTNKIIIDAEAEKFITLFNKTFTEETVGSDSEDGPAGDIAAKMVLKIREKTSSAFGNNTATKLILEIVGITVKKNGKDKNDSEAEISEHRLNS